jgi:SNF2 family DNA or RNA helicase
MLKRGNILNAEHLPPKLVQFVCCQLTDLQKELYDKLISAKNGRHIRDGKAENTLNSIRQLINICSHPRMLIDSYRTKLAKGEEDEELAALVPLIPEVSIPLRATAKTQSLHSAPAGRGPSRSGTLKVGSTIQVAGGSDGYINPEESGKMFVLYRLMQVLNH